MPILALRSAPMTILSVAILLKMSWKVSNSVSVYTNASRKQRFVCCQHCSRSCHFIASQKLSTGFVSLHLSLLNWFSSWIVMTCLSIGTRQTKSTKEINVSVRNIRVLDYYERAHIFEIIRLCIYLDIKSLGRLLVFSSFTSPINSITD